MDTRSARGADQDDGGSDLLRITRGDPDGLSALYDRYAPQMFGAALRVTRDRGTAEDVLQEAFLAIWKSAARFDATRGSVRTWVVTIARRRAIDAVRRQRDVTVPLAADEAADARHASPDVWPSVMASLDAEAVRRALGVLPDAQRRAIELAYFGGLTQHEIATATGAPLGTVKSRVRMGLRRLGDVLGGSFGDVPAPAVRLPVGAEHGSAEMVPSAH